MGQFPTTLAIQPEDVDGDVIIASPGGTAPFSISSLAYGTSIDGSHIQLSPVGGSPPTVTPGTLTVAAAGCPPATVTIKNSPAIYAQTGSLAYVFDWYGDYAYTGFLSVGDVLVGYDSTNARLIAYNASSGLVSAYSPGFGIHTTLYTILPNSLVTWSNALHQTFAAHWNGSTTTFYTFNGTTYTNNPQTLTTQIVALATSANSSSPNAFASSGAEGHVYQINVSTNAITSSVPPYTVDALAINDYFGYLLEFNSASPFLTQTPTSLNGVYSSANFGFAAPAAFAAADIDVGNEYAVTTHGAVEFTTFGGVTLPSSDYFNVGSPPAGLVVVSGR